LNRHCDRERSEREAIQRQKTDLWIASPPFRAPLDCFVALSGLLAMTVLIQLDREQQ
jgi:hypothetical protein